MYLLSERQAGEAWEPSNKQCSFRNREIVVRKNFHFSDLKKAVPWAREARIPSRASPRESSTG
jgi:hypothetical protein